MAALEADAPGVLLPVADQQAVSHLLGVGGKQPFRREPMHSGREGVNLCRVHRRAMGPAPAVSVCARFVGR
jgi:hypothetical protein